MQRGAEHGDSQALPWEDHLERLATWLRGQVATAGLDGVTFGLSGGVDSAVVAGLCVRAVGDRALGIIMPCHSAPEDVADAELVAQLLRVSVVTVDLSAVYDRMVQALDPVGLPGTVCEADLRLADANLKPRLRMTTLYHYANRHRLLVVGTSNRSEIHVGYATKHGDAGVDVQPIAHLLKREVRCLASALGLPPRIVNRVPSAGLWPGQTDEGEMELTYAELDDYLASGCADAKVRDRIDRMHLASTHKRSLPARPI